jgi:hypothetical protein
MLFSILSSNNKPKLLESLVISSKEKDLIFSRRFNMMYHQTFQHRAKISSLKKNFNLPDQKKKTSNSSIDSVFLVSQFTKKKISLSKKGKKLEKNVICKISDSLKKRVLTEKHKNNLKKALSGVKNPMFGRLHTKYIKRKISKSLAKKKM